MPMPDGRVVEYLPRTLSTAKDLERQGIPADAATVLAETSLTPRAEARLRQHYQGRSRRKGGTLANVLFLHRKGLPVAEIAVALQLTKRTVSTHLAHARERGHFTDPVETRYRDEIDHLAAEVLTQELLDGNPTVALAVARGRGHLHSFEDVRQEGHITTDNTLRVVYEGVGELPAVDDPLPGVDGETYGTMRRLLPGDVGTDPSADE